MTTIAVAGLLTLAVSGCGGGSSPGSSGTAPGGAVPGGAGNPLGVALPDNVTNGSANVTLASNTVKISRSTVASELLDVSNFGSQYVFSSTGGGVGSLHPGSIMFLEGTAIRTVTSVSPKGGGVIVDTSDATLEDAFSSANISFNQHVSGDSGGTIETGAMPSGSYSTVPTPTPSPAAASHDSAPAGTSVIDLSDLISRPVRLTSAGYSATTTIAGWSVTMTVSPSSNRLDFDVEATKGSDPQVTLSGKGYVSDFIAASDIDIASGQLVHGGFSAQNLTGQITFTWKAVAQLVKLSKNLIKLPLNYTIPIVVGGIPFSLGIGCEFLATIGFTSKDTVVAGDTTVNFGPGSEGFTVTKSAGMTVAGLMSGIGQIIQSAIPTVTVGPLGIVLAIELPRISLGVGVVGTQAGAYVDVVSSTGVTDAGVLGLIPCHDVKLDVTGGAGVSASIFGIAFNGLPKTTLFTKTYDLSNPPGCLGQ